MRRMHQKNTIFILLGIIILLIFTSGCTKLKVDQNQKIFNSLMEQLNSVVNNYKASYKKEHKVSSWAGHSGSTDYTEKSEIYIEVSDGQVINYTIKYTKYGWPVEKEDYYKYYDKSKHKLCQEEIISKSSCNPIPLSPPKLGGVLNGCKIRLGPVDRENKCICELKSIQDYLGFPCSEKKNTTNMKIINKCAIYYPETKKGFCYYLAQDLSSGEVWAFECDQQEIELQPLVTTNIEPLKNVSCFMSGDSYCTCNFNPVKTLVCSDEKPTNFDSDLKDEIRNYLKNKRNYLENKTISFMFDDQYGLCYTFFYKKLKHIFCFDEQNLLTFAQWGKNITKKSSTSVNINKVKMNLVGDHSTDYSSTTLLK